MESEELKSHIALNLFKDFSTGLYQISIGFNDDVYFWNEKTNELKPANSLFLLYDCDYRLVINDAEQILLEYQTERKIRLGKLKFVDYKIEFAPQIQFTEQEVDEIINGNRWYVERNGEIYFVKGKNNWILDVHYKEGWETPEK